MSVLVYGRTSCAKIVIRRTWVNGKCYSIVTSHCMTYSILTPKRFGLQRKRLPELCRLFDYMMPPAHRSDTVSIDKVIKVPWEVGEIAGAETSLEDSVHGEEWVKGSWKKGECRQEIILISEASSLGFDEARIVTLRLFNHFRWLKQLQLRTRRLLAVVRRERLKSFSFFQRATLPRQYLSGTHKHSTNDEASCDSGDDARGSFKGDFSLYVRGICALCREGDFDDVLSFLFRVYSAARKRRVIGRAELTLILESHVIYDHFDDPIAEKERIYRWLKRQLINLAASPTKKPIGLAEDGPDSLEGTTNTRSRTRADKFLVTWKDARELLRGGPHGLKEIFAINLPRLSADLWSEDLISIRRMKIGTKSWDSRV